jgi:formylmethanofuran--tetrahydromethanopterin N-formyltransferase
MNGIMGANFWYMCSEKKTVTKAGNAALNAIEEVEGVVAPFDICSAASKPETNYPWIGPTTNHPYCPSLKSVLNDVSKVPENVNYIPEIVLNGLNQKVLEEGMKAGIEAVIDFDDVSLVSAGNYNGLLGEYRIDLRSLFE